MEDPSTIIVALFVLVPLGAMYFLPAIIAHRKGHRQSSAIFWLNFLLGWSCLGWIIALIWALSNPAPNTVVVYRDRED